MGGTHELLLDDGSRTPNVSPRRSNGALLDDEDEALATGGSGSGTGAGGGAAWPPHFWQPHGAGAQQQFGGYGGYGGKGATGGYGG